MNSKTIAVLAQVELLISRAAEEARLVEQEASVRPYGRSQVEISRVWGERKHAALVAKLFVDLLRTAYKAIQAGAKPEAALEGFEAPEKSLLAGMLRAAREIAAGQRQVNPRVLERASIRA